MSFILSIKRLSLLATALAPVVLMTGCGIGTSSSVNTSIVGLSGLAHGGPNPIAGSTITLYATATAPYGTASTQLAQTTTDASGFFSFSGVAVCPAGQQAYVTASGGNTGGNTNNANVLLMAALGPCATILPTTHIFMSEVSTVAAGYALSNFIGISGTTVNVSAPATNNAAVPACTGTGTAMTCSAAGLAHAFLNAANLVNAVSNGTAPTGQTYTTTPGNSNTVVPTLLINTLGNILQSCVNSTGGVAGDSTNCGKLFTNTTPPTSSIASPVTPANTLQAVVNLAKYPSMTPTQVPALFALATPQTFFAPALAAAPTDYSLGIAYHGPTAAVNYVYAFYSTIDVTDQIYTLSEIGNGSGAVTLNQINSNGANGAASGTITNALCAAPSPCAAATDTLGNLWLANTNSANLNVYQISTATGAVLNTYALPVGTAPNSAAVDRNNTVYVTSANTTAADLFSKAFAASSFTSVLAGSGPTAVQEAGGVQQPEYIAIDAAGSIWNTNFTSVAGGGVNTTYIQNTGTINAPVFGNAPLYQTESATLNQPYAINFDAAGNAWVNTITSLFKIAPGATTPTTTLTTSAPTATTPKLAASTRFSTLDGDGNIFLPDNTGAVVFQYLPGTGNFIYLSPCTGNTGTACLGSGLKVAAPRNAFMDSTGSVWVTDPSATVANGNLVQIIGTGAPTWGQASYGHPGVRP